MFTIHLADRDGKPHKELASTPYSDVARAIALAIARWNWPEDSRVTQDNVPEGEIHLLIQEDGEPYSRVVLRPAETKRWTVEGGVH